jgi:hypothetical protein
MFRAYLGRSPGLGEGTLLVLLRIADVTGISKIVEAIAGDRAFSNGHEMSKTRVARSPSAPSRTRWVPSLTEQLRSTTPSSSSSTRAWSGDTKLL